MASLQESHLIREDIYQTIETLVPHDSLEQMHIEKALCWIRSGVGIFRIAKPATPDMHLVSYFMLVDPERGKVLLCDHKKAGLWLPTGGHVEPGEHPRQTVEREVQEELGVVAQFLMESPLFITVTKTTGNVAIHTDVTLWYVLKGSCNEELIFDSEEFHAIRWFESQEIPFEKSDPYMKRFIAKLLPQVSSG
ncbi:MAG: NUDIX domain-containing protein [Parachlamydia sp.]|nr:NUDIX domain-containing protein [Parachlamydia sp.]